jgi:hypothetical protein
MHRPQNVHEQLYEFLEEVIINQLNEHLKTRLFIFYHGIENSTENIPKAISPEEFLNFLRHCEWFSQRGDLACGHTFVGIKRSARQPFGKDIDFFIDVPC